MACDDIVGKIREARDRIETVLEAKGQDSPPAGGAVIETDKLRDRIRRTHISRPYMDGPRCAFCGQRWPCDTLKVLEASETSFCPHCPTIFPIIGQMIECIKAQQDLLLLLARKYQ